MNIHTITVGAFEVNCYLVRVSANEALLIDPGADAEILLDEIERQRVRVVAYLLTHGHADHVGALPVLAHKHPAPLYIHKADAAWAFTSRNQLPPYYEAPAKPSVPFHLVSEENVYSDLAYSFRVIETPGHTPGGVCYYFDEEGVLFSGDTLFFGSVGRTDLPGASARALSDSLRKLAKLPDATKVFPGHGPSTTIGEEKYRNVFFRSVL